MNALKALIFIFMKLFEITGRARVINRAVILCESATVNAIISLQIKVEAYSKSSRISQMEFLL